MNGGRFEAEPAIYKPIDQRPRLLKTASILMLFYTGLRSWEKKKKEKSTYQDQLFSTRAASAAVPTEVRSIV